jgi:hypothetical protein
MVSGGGVLRSREGRILYKFVSGENNNQAEVVIVI